MTVNVPNGADLSSYITQLKNGDILSLAAGGNYTTALTGLPNGYPDQYTTIEGNGATITGLATAIDTTAGGLHYVQFNDINLRHQTNLCIYIRANSTYLNFSNIDILVDNATATLDATRLQDASNITFDNCTVHDCDVNHDSFDGFEIFDNCQDITFQDCTVDTLVGGGTPAHHGFEVYAPLGGTASANILFDNCSATGCDVGFSAEGGPDSLAHVEVVADGCSGYSNNDYGYQGVNGSTLYRENVADGTNTGNGTAETNGTVTDRS